ncbi:MAG: DNA-3-methyladenine glycosylase 2 family protein [Pseudomonadota bacterium]
MTAPSEDLLVRACVDLSRADPALQAAYEAIGLPVWRSRPVAYETIAKTIAYQQISVKAAAAIWARVEEALEAVTAEAVEASTEDDLRALGLSRPKIRHLKSVAGAILAGDLDLDRVATAEMGAARDELLCVKGIGPWTAELFLLYARGEPDAFPVADLGLMEAHKRLSGAETRMDRAAFTSHAEAWRPWRGVAAHLLWGWLNAERDKASGPS